MDFSEKTINSIKIFSGKVVNLRVDEVILPDGRKGNREIVEHNGGVAIVPIKDNKIVLVKQYRKPLENILIELPAGKLELNEDPYSCALRELEEETGLVATNLKSLTCIFTAPGFCSEKLYLFVADEFIQGTVNRDEDEFLDVLYYDLPEVLDMIKNGEITDAKTICGILLYSLSVK